jgi:hypothetical protein
MKLAATFCAGVAVVSQAPTATAAGRPAYWSLTKLMRVLDGKHLRVGGRLVRIDRDTLLCSGIGRGVRRDGIRRWRRFDCTYSLFMGSRIYDCEFRVLVMGSRRLEVRNSRWIAGAP